jgi:hypothetical protein
MAHTMKNKAKLDANDSWRAEKMTGQCMNSMLGHLQRVFERALALL